MQSCGADTKCVEEKCHLKLKPDLICCILLYGFTMFQVSGLCSHSSNDEQAKLQWRSLWVGGPVSGLGSYEFVSSQYDQPGKSRLSVDSVDAISIYFNHF